LWFVGDPRQEGHERRGNFHLHRWCQWISDYHPHGVYDGEHVKCDDYAKSLPPFMFREVLEPHLRAGGRAVVLAEEWHTAHAVLHLDWLLRGAGLRDRVCILWNANNTFGFEAIDWPRLNHASVLCTVSRYMKYLMQGYGVDPLVFPNGLSADCFVTPDSNGVHALRTHLDGRVVLAKVARFDPDKRWLLAMDTVGELKRQGMRPILIARGGLEAHGTDVLARAAADGLRVVERTTAPGLQGMLDAVRDPDDADVLNLRTPLDADSRRVLLRGADAVLANSGHEPFGLVGLETMAAEGVAVTGCSGEDYAIPDRNALVMQTSDPREFVGLFHRLHQDPAAEDAMRKAGKETARAYAWPEILSHSFLPRLQMLGSWAPANDEPTAAA
jgi:glycosyltransferase involved in cell wall biosynthesis